MNNKINIKNILIKKLDYAYVLNSSDYKSQSDLLDFAAKIISNDNVAIIINDFDTKSNMLLENSFKLRQLCSLYNRLFFVKDRIDILKIVKADGIILDKNSINIKYAKMLLDDDIIIGYILNNETLNQDIVFDFTIKKDAVNSNKYLIERLYNDNCNH